LLRSSLVVKVIKNTFMLPCVVIDFLLNNQPDALIIQIYSVIKLMQVSDDRFQAE